MLKEWRHLVAPVHKPRSVRRQLLNNDSHRFFQNETICGAPRQRDLTNKVWLFDLDNTLHDASACIFPSIDRKMNEAVQSLLNLDKDAANQLRQTYWHRYGATLIGMVRHHGVDAAEFLARSHDFDVAQSVRYSRRLTAWLKRVPGRKVIVTNAPASYARQVLKIMGITRYFDAIWSVEDMRIHGQFRVKPSQQLLSYILAREGVKASECIFVEDTLRNLRPAKRLGMKTVWLAHTGTPISKVHSGKPQFVDYKYQCLSQSRCF